MPQMGSISSPMAEVDILRRKGMYSRIIKADIMHQKGIINRMGVVDTSPLMASIYSLMGWGDGINEIQHLKIYKLKFCSIFRCQENCCY